MGQKVNPIGFRVGINKPWDSQWTASKKDFPKFLLEDKKIREYIRKKYYNSSVSKMNIQRTSSKIIITILSSRPGILIGNKGTGVALIKEEIKKITDIKNVFIEIREINKPDTDATLIAQNVAGQIEKRIAWKRAINMSIQRAMKSGVKGVKIMISGRLNGADIANSAFYNEGSIPLHTIRADIDYGTALAMTTFGVIGLKVWVYKGEILDKKSLAISDYEAERKGGSN